MSLQILFIILFAVNMLLIWATYITKKLEWYRFPGYLFFAVLPLATVFFDQPRFAMDYYWWKVAGIVIMVFGVIIVAWAKIELFKRGMWVTDRPKALVTTGPYHFVRHPFYLGLILIIVGWWWVWAAVYSFYLGMFILLQIWVEAYFEEKAMLVKQFGDEYKQYRHVTGMFWVK